MVSTCVVCSTLSLSLYCGYKMMEGGASAETKATQQIKTAWQVFLWNTGSLCILISEHFKEKRKKKNKAWEDPTCVWVVGRLHRSRWQTWLLPQLRALRPSTRPQLFTVGKNFVLHDKKFDLPIRKSSCRDPRIHQRRWWFSISSFLRQTSAFSVAHFEPSRKFRARKRRMF